MMTALGTSIMMPERHVLGALVPRRVDLLHRLLEQAAHLAQLLHARDHGDHDAKIAVRARPDHRPQLREEHVGPRQGQPHRAKAERRVHLGRELEARGELVAADVERAQRHRARRHRLDHRAIELVLLVLVGILMRSM
jgi:hypothetical protein